MRGARGDSGDGEVVPPTLIERLNALLPMPYAAACLLVAALVGPLGFFILDFLTTLDAGKALQIMSSSVNGPYTTLQNVGNNLVYPAVVFYCAFMIRVMRRKIVSLEPELESLSPEWKAALRRSFGHIASTWPPVLITAAMTLALAPLLLTVIGTNAGINQVYLLVSYPIFFFAAATFVWTYAGALWGLHGVGRQNLRLKPFHEDPLLGLGSLGSLSLSLTAVFFLGVFLGTLLISVFVAELPLPFFALFIGSLTFVGLALFFVPLLSAHGRMEEEKERLRQGVVTEVAQLAQGPATSEGVSRATLAKQVKRALVLEVDRKEIEVLPTWPLNTPMVGRLIVVLLSVFVSIASHAILVSLRL